MRLAILFSGQGNQQPEHLRRLRAEAPPALAAALATAIPSVWHDAEVTPAALLANRVAQPLIFALQASLWQQLRPGLPRPVCVAGYSLGEMAACCAADAFSVDDGLALCGARAQLMDACVAGPAGLLAIVGLPAAAVTALAAECGLAVAIRNGPDHFVLGGPEAGLARAASLAEGQGAARVVRLGVTTPSHTPWLAEASRAFAARLQPFSAGRLAFPVLSAIDGRPARHGADATAALARQISTTLDWAACLDAVAEMQPDAVLEIGPGNALARMWSERETAVPARATDDFRSVEGILAWVQARA